MVALTPTTPSSKSSSSSSSSLTPHKPKPTPTPMITQKAQKQIHSVLGIQNVTDRIWTIRNPGNRSVKQMTKLGSCKLLESKPLEEFCSLASSKSNGSDIDTGTFETAISNLMHAHYLNAYIQQVHSEQVLVLDYGFLEEYFYILEEHHHAMNTSKGHRVDFPKAPSVEIIQSLSSVSSPNFKLDSGRIAFNNSFSSIPPDSLTQLKSFPLDTLLNMAHLVQSWLKINPKKIVLLVLPKKICPLLMACILYYIGDVDPLSSAVKRSLRIYKNQLLVKMKYSRVWSKNLTYLKKFEKAITDKHLQTESRWISPTILLTNLILHRVPKYGVGGCQLYIEIIQDSMCVYTSNPEGGGDIVVPSTVFQQLTVDIPLSFSLSGEAKLYVYHRPPRGTVANKSCMIFNTTVHSALLSATETTDGSIHFGHQDLDYCSEDTAISPHFGMDVLYNFVDKHSHSMEGKLKHLNHPHKRNRILRHYLEDAAGKEVYGTASAPVLSEALQIENGELLDEEEAEIELATPIHVARGSPPRSVFTINVDLATEDELDTEYCLEYQQQLQFEEEMREIDKRHNYLRSTTTPTSSPALCKSFHFTATIVSQPVT